MRLTPLVYIGDSVSYVSTTTPPFTYHFRFTFLRWTNIESTGTHMPHRTHGRTLAPTRFVLVPMSLERGIPK